MAGIARTPLARITGRYFHEFHEESSTGISVESGVKGRCFGSSNRILRRVDSIGVLRKARPHEKIVNNFPPFIIPKPAEPDEFRTIADGKAGRQNEVCVADPCHITSPDHILPYLYTNGWLASLDLSKFFHMFLTLPSEHKYLGMTHPGTKAMYVYDRFSMGTRNSPGGAGKFGASYIRSILDSSPVFQGRAYDNSLQTYFVRTVHHPQLGEGQLLIGSDGLPVVLIWLHVDDKLIHSPTHRKLIITLEVILLKALTLGLIYNNKKTVSPTQTIKFCGFLYNHISTPYLTIPEYKTSRALSLILYLQQLGKRCCSRILLSMIVGCLQSLVPATPDNIGASFLRLLYLDLHRPQPKDAPGTPQFYHTRVCLGPLSLLCLDW